MDYVFFNAGECNDSLRDRWFLVVSDAHDFYAAKGRLYQYMLSECDDDENAAMLATQDYEVFLSGEHIRDGGTNRKHYDYRWVDIP